MQTWHLQRNKSPKSKSIKLGTVGNKTCIVPIVLLGERDKEIQGPSLHACWFACLHEGMIRDVMKEDGV